MCTYECENVLQIDSINQITQTSLFNYSQSVHNSLDLRLIEANTGKHGARFTVDCNLTN